MEPLYFECHHFDPKNDETIIVYRVTEERVMDHTLYVLKSTIDEQNPKPKWKSCGSYHYLDQVLKEVYSILCRLEEEKGNRCKDYLTDFLSIVNNRIEENDNYLYVYGTARKKIEVEKTVTTDWIDFANMKEVSKAKSVS